MNKSINFSKNKQTKTIKFSKKKKKKKMEL